MLVKPSCQLTGPLHCDTVLNQVFAPPLEPHVKVRPPGAVGAQAPRSLTGVHLPWQPHAVALGSSESLVLTGQHHGVLSATFWLPRAAAEQSIKDEKPGGRESQRDLGEITQISLPCEAWLMG